MKKIAFILSISFAMMLTSCKKDINEPMDNTPETMEELEVPSGFNWKTTKEITLTLTASGSGIVVVSNQQNVPYQKAYLSTSQPYVMKLSLPAFEKQVKVKFSGQEGLIELNGENLQYQFN